MHVQVLALPVHEVFQSGQAAEALFVEVEGQKLAPPRADDSLLTEAFLKASDSEREAYRFLGVGTGKLSAFYTEAVFPRLATLDGTVASAAVLAMLEELPGLCREDARFFDRLAHLAFLPTAACTLARPWELYDPSIPELEALVGPGGGSELYPSAAFCKPELIATLVRLGLRTALDRPAVLTVARSLSAAVGARDAGRPEESLLVARGRALLAALAKHAKALGLLQPAASMDAALAEATDAFVSELRALSWVPVMLESPDPHLPWAAGGPALAAPRETCLERTAPLASYGMRVCSEEVPSEPLRRLLGWEDAVSPHVLAQQLVEMAGMFGHTLAVNPLAQPLRDTSIPEPVVATIHDIYRELQAWLGREHADWPAARALLSERACVLVGGAWAHAAHVAVACEEMTDNVRAEGVAGSGDGSEADALQPEAAEEGGADLDAAAEVANATGEETKGALECGRFAPVLLTLPEELMAYEDLLLDMGVRTRFAGTDYLAALNRLADAHPHGQVLEGEQVELAARLASAAAQFKLPPAAKAALCLPDAQGRLLPAAVLVYDDAPWLSSTLSDVAFVHAAVGNAAAEALGLRSVRTLLMSGELHMRDLSCPSQDWLRKQLLPVRDTPRALAATLPAALVDVADALGARHVHVLCDMRTHAARSVLQPNLASLQGPALVVYLEGLTLSAEELCRLQVPSPAHRTQSCTTTRS